MAAAEKPVSAAGEAAPAKKGPPVVVLVAITALVAFGIAFVVVKKMTKPPAPVSTAVVIGDTVPLDEFLINLADSDSAHYLKTTIGLGLIQGKTADDFKTKVPEARDAIVMVLSNKTLDQVRTTEGKEALKTELIDHINKELGSKDVGAVYFEAFATQ
jgi:flagellar protein FliL